MIWHKSEVPQAEVGADLQCSLWDILDVDGHRRGCLSCSELPAAFPTIPGGTDSSRQDSEPSRSLGRWGSAISGSFCSSVICLKWRALPFKDGEFFSMILQILMIEMIGLWLKISGRPDGASKGIQGDLRHRQDDQNQKWHSGRHSASDVPQPQGAGGWCVCVHARRFEGWHFLSRTLLHLKPSLPGTPYELNGNKSSMREWGEQGSRKAGQWKFLF